MSIKNTIRDYAYHVPGGKALVRNIRLRRLSHFPVRIQVETTNICNARCPFCPVHTSKRKHSVMADELFRKIVDEIAKNRQNCEHFGLFLNGEPLLDPKLPERIRYAKKNGLQDIFISTNASRLSRDKSAAIMDAGLSRLVVSLDGTTKQTYEKMRVGLIFEEVIENVERFIELRDKRFPHVKIDMQIIDTGATRRETDIFLSKWKGRVDNTYIKECHDWAGQMPGIRGASGKAEPRRKPCPILWHDLYIYVDGLVPLCCFDTEGTHILGDINVQDIREVWQGGQIGKMRASHLKNKFADIPLCEPCPNTRPTGDEPSWWFT